jgi:hypothetical protein
MSERDGRRVAVRFTLSSCVFMARPWGHFGPTGGILPPRGGVVK